jgi:hypothetical protein
MERNENDRVDVNSDESANEVVESNTKFKLTVEVPVFMTFLATSIAGE